MFQGICWDIYYFSERLRCRLSKKLQTFNELQLWKKKKLVEGRCVREVPRGFRAMHIFSSTYFDEISIFGLSKDQTFRIWSTFMNPEQFLILVPYQW